jgi:hypothetical protein
MNMHDAAGGVPHIMAMDIVVGLAVLFTLFLVAAWFASPRLRQWLERPKVGFQAAVGSYDKALRSGSTLEGGKTPR